MCVMGERDVTHTHTHTLQSESVGLNLTPSGFVLYPQMHPRLPQRIFVLPGTLFHAYFYTSSSSAADVSPWSRRLTESELQASACQLSALVRFLQPFGTRAFHESTVYLLLIKIHKRVRLQFTAKLGIDFPELRAWLGSASGNISKDQLHFVHVAGRSRRLERGPGPKENSPIINT